MYPTLKGYQLTPLAPIFSKVYRSISNSIVIPNTSVLKIVPIEDSHKKISFIKDGIENEYKDISYFEFKKSKTMLYKTAKLFLLYAFENKGQYVCFSFKNLQM